MWFLHLGLLSPRALLGDSVYGCRVGGDVGTCFCFFLSCSVLGTLREWNRIAFFVLLILPRSITSQMCLSHTRNGIRAHDRSTSLQKGGTVLDDAFTVGARAQEK